MEKKTIICIITIIIIISLGYYCFTMFFNENNIYTPPSFEINQKNENEIVLTNNSTDIRIYKIKNDSNLNDFINKYVERNKEKYEIEIYNNNHSIIKTVAQNENITISKYWTKKNNIIYQVQINNNYNKNDEYAKEILNSINENNFNNKKEIPLNIFDQNNVKKNLTLISLKIQKNN